MRVMAATTFRDSVTTSESRDIGGSGDAGRSVPAGVCMSVVGVELISYSLCFHGESPPSGNTLACLSISVSCQTGELGANPSVENSLPRLLSTVE